MVHESNTSEPPTQIFLSYVHADEEAFGFVDPLVTGLSQFAKSGFGVSLKFFVDREGIGWGEDWRQRIDDSVEKSVIFIPIITAEYFNHEACRDEFLAFHTKSASMGTGALLLPIVLLGRELISADSDDEIVRIVEARQYRPITEAFLAGYDSSDWRSALHGLAGDLHKVVRSVEDILSTAALNSDEASPSSLSLVISGESDDGDDDPGLFDLVEEFTGSVQSMTADIEPISSAIQQLGEAANDFDPEGVDEIQAMNRMFIAVAMRFRAPAEIIQRSGTSLIGHTATADRCLKRLESISRVIEDSEFRGQVEDSILDIVGSLDELDEVEATLNELLSSMRTVELVSAPVRKALRPVRAGVRSINDSLTIIRGWKGIESSILARRESGVPAPNPEGGT